MKYQIYATLLDSFWGYLNSDVIYNRYWGFSENPPHTEEEFQQKQFQELIDRINRVPFDSEAADKGTAFNEIVDCIIENRNSELMDIRKETINNNLFIVAKFKEREFSFPVNLCREFASYFKGALTQQRVEAILPTSRGDVLLYGVIDELMPTSIHDIKTTGNYSAFKFKDHFQHLVYPYCLYMDGSYIRDFEYNITDFKETYTEYYTFIPERDIPVLTSHCEMLIDFIEENKSLITDKKIFNE